MCFALMCLQITFTTDRLGPCPIVLELPHVLVFVLEYPFITALVQLSAPFSDK